MRRSFGVCLALVFIVMSQLSMSSASCDADGICTHSKETIIVVGGGLAGMSAAIEAEKNGAHVTLIEKEKDMGGNSAKASSGINAVGTAAQKAQLIEDSIEMFVQDTIKSGQGLSEEKLVRQLVENSADAVSFLTSFDLPLNVLSRCGGHSAPRTHRNGPDARGRVANVGFSITARLADYLGALPPGRIDIIMEAKLNDLVTDDQGGVVGVIYTKNGETTKLFADAVILATGGHSRSSALLKEFSPEIASFASTNGGFATGDGVVAARKIGADLALMDKVQLHPTGLVDPKDPNNPTKFLGPEALRAAGGILLNQEGKRFTNELGLRDAVTNSILAHCAKLKTADGSEGPVVSYLIMNNDAVQEFQAQTFAFYQSKGFVSQYENAEALAKGLGVDSSVITDTLTSYDASATAGKDEFGKTYFPVVFKTDETLFALLITPAIHYTMGGVHADADTRVLKNGKPILGLFAAGEVTGGLHGQNRLAGNSLLECVVYGRIAGQRASEDNVGSENGISRAVLAKLESVVGADRFSVRPGVRLSHGRDHSYHPARMPDAVAWPLNAEEVSGILKICNKYNIPVIPYGVGSSLEGHTSALEGGLTLNMTLMNNIVEVHEGEMAVTVQAGIRRIALNKLLEDKGIFFPIDPGADASIGGMAATGASGTLAVGYGTMRENIIRMKVVTAEGEIFQTGSRARKSSAGYDLSHIFIGSEGTLGIIMEITLKVYEIPTTAAAVCSFADLEKASRTIATARAKGIHAQRIELLNARAIEAVNKKFNTTHTVTPKLFLEFHGVNEEEVQLHAAAFKKIADENQATEFAIATAEKERNELWACRHGAYWASASICPQCKLFVTDVCVPMSRLAECVVETEKDFAKSRFGVPPIVGHAGDGNFHVMLPLDVNNPDAVKEAYELNERMVYRAISMDGTCTGEHGVGYGKIPFVRKERGEVAIDLMQRMKKTLDPNGIMNPGKIF